MKQYSELEIELMKVQAVQDYLLTRGSNDEEINARIRELKDNISEQQKQRNR